MKEQAATPQKRKNRLPAEQSTGKRFFVEKSVGQLLLQPGLQLRNRHADLLHARRTAAETEHFGAAKISPEGGFTPPEDLKSALGPHKRLRLWERRYECPFLS